jgi:flagellar hook-associated protein 3 FlgL
MRVSTAQIFNSGINAINRNQGEMAHTQEQLATGRRIVRPSDDPAGSLQALKIRERMDAVDQYSRNANLAQSKLQYEETVLTNMGEALQRVRELTLQGMNASQTDESRAVIAREVRLIGEALLDSANTRDANGEYLFAGTRSASTPFVRNGQGEIEYLGNGAVREVALSPDRKLPIGHSGHMLSEIPRGNGFFVATPDASNTGTARVTASEVLNPTQIDGESYSIHFIDADTYEILDSDGDPLGPEQSYTPGQAIDIGGRRVLIEGTPEAGDSISVEPAGTQSLFATIDQLISALEMPRSGSAEMAEFRSEADLALLNIDQAMDQLLSARTEVGGRLNTIDAQGLVNEDQNLQMKTMLSEIEDLDYAEAISRFTLQQVALQAAQQTYVQLSRNSLFDYLR